MHPSQFLSHDPVAKAVAVQKNALLQYFFLHGFGNSENALIFAHANRQKALVNARPGGGKQEEIIAEIAQLVERNLAKVEVAGPSPVFRSRGGQKETPIESKKPCISAICKAFSFIPLLPLRQKAASISRLNRDLFCPYRK